MRRLSGFRLDGGRGGGDGGAEQLLIESFEPLLTLNEFGAERRIAPIWGGFFDKKDDDDDDDDAHFECWEGFVEGSKEQANLFLRLAGFSGLGGGVSALGSRVKESQLIFLKSISCSSGVKQRRTWCRPKLEFAEFAVVSPATPPPRVFAPLLLRRPRPLNDFEDVWEEFNVPALEHAIEFRGLILCPASLSRDLDLRLTAVQEVYWILVAG